MPTVIRWSRPILNGTGAAIATTTARVEHATHIGAHALDRLVCERLHSWLSDTPRLLDALAGQDPHAVLDRAPAQLDALERDPGHATRLVDRITVRRDHIRLTLNAQPFGTGVTLEAPRPCPHGRKTMVGAPVEPNPALVCALVHAHQWLDQLRAGETVSQLATTTGYSRRYIGRVLALNWLAPDIQLAILDGTQPWSLSLFLKVAEIPLGFDAQRQWLGLDPPSDPGSATGSAA